MAFRGSALGGARSALTAALLLLCLDRVANGAPLPDHRHGIYRINVIATGANSESIPSN